MGKPFRAQTLFAAVRTRKQTFEEIASEYGYTLEEFEQQARLLVGPKEFTKLKRDSEQNQKNKPKPRKKKILMPPVFVTEEDNNMQKNLTREKLLQQKINAEREIAVAQAAVDAEEVLLTAESNKIKKAKLDFENAEKALKSAERAYQKREDNYQKVLTKLSSWETCLETIEANIREIDSKIIYLIAPGYKGALPTVGQLFSVIPFDGATVEKGGELFKEPTAMDLLDSGFELISEAKNAFNFARLVIKYMLDEVEVKVLVDDDRIKQILLDQGLEF